MKNGYEKYEYCYSKVRGPVKEQVILMVQNEPGMSVLLLNKSSGSFNLFIAQFDCFVFYYRIVQLFV